MSLLDTSDDFTEGPRMIGPCHMAYGREVSQVETRDIDRAALDLASDLIASEQRPIRILDLGCGTGFNAERFARMGCHVTAVDLRESADDISERNRTLVREGRPIIEFVNEDITRIDYHTLLDTEWDIVFLNRVLHFIPERQMTDVIEHLMALSPPHTHFVINFRSSDHKTPQGEGRTYIESDEDGCLPTYYLHNAKKFLAALENMGCEIVLREEHDYLCLLFLKRGNDVQPALLPRKHGRQAPRPLAAQYNFAMNAT